MSTPHVRSSMSAQDWAVLLLLGLLWGASFFFAKVALVELEPLALVAWRVIVAAAALHLYLRLAGPSFRLALSRLPAFAGLALLNNLIPFGLIFTGQTAIGAGLASVLNATTPFWTLLVMRAFGGDEHLSANRLAGLACGVAGTAVMVGSGVLADVDGPLWAKAALLGAALSYAFALLYARRFRGLPAPLIACGQLTMSAAIMAPIAWAVGRTGALWPQSASVWAAVFALAVLSTALAYILYFRLVQTAGATNASLVTLVVPASATLLGAAILGERLSWEEGCGMALIALGLITIDGRALRTFVKKP